MSEDKNARWLVPRPDFSLGKSTSGSNRVLADMVDQTLALARQQQGIVAKTFRIGRYEWCEPDYRQIIIWAKALSFEPEEVIHRLLEGKMTGPSQWGDPEWKKMEFADGRLLRLHWRFDLLPIESLEWVDGLAITHLAFSSSARRIPRLSLCLPSLTHLVCGWLGLLELDLSNMPKLESLVCAGNRLTELDLSKVPMLMRLRCHQNKITKLKFSTMPMLTGIDCWDNLLTELDLSKRASKK
jgi:hypothetical protein